MSKLPKAKRGVAKKAPRVRTERNQRRATKLYLGEDGSPPVKRAVPSKKVLDQAGLHSPADVQKFSELVGDLSQPVVLVRRTCVEVLAVEGPMMVTTLRLEFKARSQDTDVRSYDLIGYPEGRQEELFHTAMGRAFELIKRYAYGGAPANEAGCWRLLDEVERMLRGTMLRSR